MELFTTTLDLYGGVLWSGELQGFIIRERVPTSSGYIDGMMSGEGGIFCSALQCSRQKSRVVFCVL
jgi:hypothetical protein